MTLDLTSLGWWTLEGRGRVASVASPITFDRRENPLLGQVIRIDGEWFEVLGVESYALPMIAEGTAIGLLVRAADRPIP